MTEAALARHDTPAHDPALLARLARMAQAIRRYALIAIHHAGSGHPGGALSAADLLAVLYGAELNLTPATAADPGRDRFVLSKGHGAPALYAAWAAAGFIAPHAVIGLRRLGTPYQGHPHVLDTPLAETSTGSLGQGFSVAIGMAMGLRHLKSPARVYTMLGDGELQEGEVWEGAMCAAHHGLSQLCAIVDYNKLQSDDTNANICALEPLADKWRAFGWTAIELDGHDPGAILNGFAAAAAETARPSVLIAHTVKGRGVPFMENVPHWHGSVKTTPAQITEALAALELSPDDIERWIDGHVR